MKITLINPFITSSQRYGRNISVIGGHQAPLGLCYLAAFLKKNGFEVSLIDAEKDRLDNSAIINRIKTFMPDAIGITSTTVAFNRAHLTVTDIKLFNADIPIIIGGPHVTANPYKTLSSECFDYGIMKEGEITLCELLKALKDGSSIRGTQGIIYRENGKVIINPPRPYIKDLDFLPFPARHLLPEIKKYLPPLGCYIKKPVISMITSRGCPYECIFCDNNVFGRFVRYHSPEYVVGEIESAIELYGAKEIFFLDDTFTINEERVKKILFLLKEKKLKIKWSCMTNVKNLTKELLSEMKNAGCWQIAVGVESGNQKVLDFIKKKINLDEVKNAVKWSRELGIYVKGFFMLGHPIDTIETINETINFAKSSPFDDVVVTIATPMPGTEFYSIAPEFGRLRENNWLDFSYWKTAFVPQSLTERILYQKQRQFYRDFYFRPGVVLRQLSKIGKQ